MPNRRIHYWLIGLLAALTLTAGIAIIYYVGAPSGPATLRVGFMRISAALPFFVAQQRGLFAANEVQIDPVVYTAGQAMLDDLLTDRIDASITGPADILLNAELATPGRFRIYMHSIYSPESPLYSLVVRSDSPIRSTADLKGRKLAAAPGPTNAALVALALEMRHGFRRGRDFSISGVAPGQQLNALRAGLYDALFPLEATGTVASTSADLRVVEWAPVESTVMNPLPITAFALSTAAISHRRTTVRRFVTAMEQAVDAIRSDEESARQLLVGAAALTPEQASRCGTGRFIRLSERRDARFQDLADLLVRVGATKQRVNVNALYYEP